MRVLFMAPHDGSGALYWLTQALRRHGIADARLVTLREPDPREGWPDVARVHDGGQELRTLVQRADVIHMVDLVPDQLPIVEHRHRRARMVFQRDRSLSTLEASAVTEAAGEHGARVVVTQPGLLPKFDDFLLPYVPFGVSPWVPLMPGARARSRAGVISIVAMGEQPLRESASLESMVDQIETRIAGDHHRRLEVLCARPHRWAVGRQRRAHLVLTDARDGLPREAIEAMALGLPVVCPLSSEHAKSYAYLGGGSRPPVFNPDELGRILELLHPDNEPDPAIVDWVKIAAAPRHWLRSCQSWYATTEIVPAGVRYGLSSSSSSAKQPSRMIS